MHIRVIVLLIITVSTARRHMMTVRVMFVSCVEMVIVWIIRVLRAVRFITAVTATTDGRSLTVRWSARWRIDVRHGPCWKE